MADFRVRKDGDIVGVKQVNENGKPTRWKAVIKIGPNLPTKHLGTCATRVEAAQAYDYAAYMIWGE